MARTIPATDDRCVLANDIIVSLGKHYEGNGFTFSVSENTSGCPIVTVRTDHGQAFNITITRARK